MASYASPADFQNYGLLTAALKSLTNAQVVAALNEASDEVDSYLAARYPLPLVAWGTTITKAACVIASWNLLSLRGFDPNNGIDQAVKMRYDDQIAWLTRVQKQMAHPQGIETTPSPSDSPQFLQPTVYSGSMVGIAYGNTARNRGW
jgi:phage gp36-like protein